jgi:hypothetical protein
MENEEDNELFIVELDERMEFGVVAIGSGIHPDTNTNCANGTNCGSSNFLTCVNGAGCHA